MCWDISSCPLRVGGSVAAVSLHQLSSTHSLSHLPCAPYQPHLLCVSYKLLQLLVCYQHNYLSCSFWATPCQNVTRVLVFGALLFPDFLRHYLILKPWLFTRSRVCLIMWVCLGINTKTFSNLRPALGSYTDSWLFISDCLNSFDSTKYRHSFLKWIFTSSHQMNAFTDFRGFWLLLLRNGC